MLQKSPSWDNNPSILKRLDDWKFFFATSNSCEKVASEEMVEKLMELSTQPTITSLLRTPRNAKTLTTKIEIFKLYGNSVTSAIYILKSLVSVQVT